MWILSARPEVPRGRPAVIVVVVALAEYRGHVGRPGTGSNQNRWGTDCLATYSWCSENFGGQLNKLSVRPGRTDMCEASTNNNGTPSTCSDGTWTLTIKVGGTRAGACGF